MKNVIIKVGGYGYRPDKDSFVQLITSKNGPISVSDDEAERLVNLGVAEYASEETSTEDLITGHLDAEDLATYSHKELQKLAKDMGLKAGGSKEELIERISGEEVYVSKEDDGSDADEDADSDTDPEEPPVLTAVDPE